VAAIDSDAHVIESERTWTYGSAAERALLPRLVKESRPDGSVAQFWEVDGVRRARTNVGDAATSPIREMENIGGRLQHMDELGVDVQVLYPSIYTQPLTQRREVDLAICRSYNRWLADVWSQGGGRLRWVAVPPVLALDEAAAELEFAKAHGACGIHLHAMEGDRLPSDPELFPLYEIASDLDMPICIHVGNNSFDVHDLFGGRDGFLLFKLPVVGAFHTLLLHQIPARFPRLRFGFIEASAQWVPYALHDLTRRLHWMGRGREHDLTLKGNRVYVAVQTDDDLPYVLRYSGEDNLLIGTDYGHKDTSTELDALRTLKEQGEVSGVVIDKILDANARVFYSL
jgi:predicted TIM-barrel fold metal-dependent hydrolase